MIEDEAKRDPKKYSLWYRDFNQFFKEGLTVDHENKDQILRLTRYRGNFSSDEVSLDDYLAKMKESQEKIYYLVTQDINNI